MVLTVGRVMKCGSSSISITFRLETYPLTSWLFNHHLGFDFNLSSYSQSFGGVTVFSDGFLSHILSKEFQHYIKKSSLFYVVLKLECRCLHENFT